VSHPWKSTGEKRTVVWGQGQPEEVLRYLRDMQDAVRYAIQIAYRDAVRDEKLVLGLFVTQLDTGFKLHVVHREDPTPAAKERAREYGTEFTKAGQPAL
jgi:hypothetical protein